LALSLLFLKPLLDSPLSDAGQKQVASVSEAIQTDDFLLKYAPELHVHSPLQRARLTHAGLFPDSPKIELECLKELSASEYLFSRTKSRLRRRILDFENWLSERDESTIVVVGHSQYFRYMLGTETVLENCSVVQCTFHPPLQGEERRWVVQDLLYSIQK
jgi:broad specificity phosphatase PhoE